MPLTPDEIARLREARYNATAVSIRKVHSDLMILRVRPDFPRPPHAAGQYCSLGLGYWEPRVEGCQDEHLKPDEEKRLVLRAYSLSCSIYSEPGILRDVAGDDWVEFYIVLVRENLDGRVPALTPRLFALKEGDRLKMFEKITGHYTTEAVKDGDTVIFLSTGTGEAPNNYMLWELLRRGHRGRLLSACCVRHQRDLAYLPTHQHLMQQFPNYTYLPLTTREAGATKKVYIQDLITSGELEYYLGSKLDAAKTHVFLCGNPKMIGVPVKVPETGARTYPTPAGVIEILEDRGFQTDNATAKIKGNIHFEEYW
jgi:ferredoxin--NADP+ reductase